MPAEPGAVYRVSLENGVLDFAVIAGGKARGLCGSGLIDLIANLAQGDDFEDIFFESLYLEPMGGISL